MVEYITDSYQECEDEESLIEGRLDLKTNPGGYPILIDGKDYGVTYDPAESIDLPAGQHTLEVLFPNRSWTKAINMRAGVRTCICLHYVSRIVDQETVTEVTEENCECEDMAVNAPNVTRERKKFKKIKKP